MAEVPTLKTFQVFTSRVQTTQRAIADLQLQIATEQRSQVYRGLGTDTDRLINMENEVTRIERYQNGNDVAMVRLNTMSTALSSARDSMTLFRDQLLDFSGQDLNNLSPEDQTALDNIQQAAFQAMKDLQYYMNSKADGRFVFSGGRTSTAPVELLEGNLNEFQSKYDGSDVTYPETRAAQLADTTRNNTDTGAINVLAFDTGDGVANNEFELDAANATAYELSSIVGSASDTGNITISEGPLIDGGTHTVRAAIKDTFAGLSVGSTIQVDVGAPAAPVGNGIFKVSGVSEDGRTITLEQQGIEAALQPINGGGAGQTVANGIGVTIRQLLPEDATISIANADDSTNDGNFRVVGYAAGQTDRLIVARPNTVPMNVGVLGANTTISATSYYKGDHLEVMHRADDNRTIDLGINAEDAAIEKAFRAFGIMAQDEPIDPGTGTIDVAEMNRRTNRALELINDALEHNPALGQELPSDLLALENRIAINQVTLTNINNQFDSDNVYLRGLIGDIENVDPTEAATNLNNALTSLEMSYAVLARVSDLTLLNFLN